MGNAGLRPDPQKQLGKRMKKAGREVLSIVLLSHDPPLPRPNNKLFFLLSLLAEPEWRREWVSDGNERMKDRLYFQKIGAGELGSRISRLR